MVEIREVRTAKDRKRFAQFVLDFYKGNPYYVPNLYADEKNILNPKKNHSLENCDAKCFLALREGKIVGRICAIVQNKYNEMSGGKFVRFCRFESVNDEEVSSALFRAAEEFGKSRGMEVLQGPWGFNDQDREGMLTEGFDRRATYATNYSYDYYPALAEKYGFAEECAWKEFAFRVPDEPDARMRRIAGLVRKQHNLRDLAETMSVRRICRQYGQKMFDCLNAASIEALQNYVPVEGKILQNVLDSFAIIVNIRYVSIVVNEADDVVGLGVVLPDVTPALIQNRGKLFPFGWIPMLRDIRRPKKLEMALIAVRPDYQKKGINAIIIDRILGNIVEDGIREIESNPELEDNLAVQSQWKNFDSEIVKRRKTFRKNI